MKFKHEALAAWQEEKDWTDTKCARFLDISTPKLWQQYKTGVVIPSVKIINKIAKNMGISAFDLIEPRPAVTSNSKIIKFRNIALIMWQKERGYSMETCAKMAGISCTSWQQYATGNGSPEGLDRYDLIASKTGIDLLDLFE